MPMTRSQEKKLWQSLGDSTQIIHRYSDGWTVRVATTTEDVRSIGVFLRNCWQSVCHYNPGYRKIAALFDADVPRVAFIINKNGLISQPLGRNNRYIREGAYQRLASFAAECDLYIAPREAMEFHPLHPEHGSNNFLSEDFAEGAPAKEAGLSAAGC